MAPSRVKLLERVDPACRRGGCGRAREALQKGGSWTNNHYMMNKLKEPEKYNETEESQVTVVALQPVPPLDVVPLLVINPVLLEKNPIQGKIRIPQENIRLLDEAQLLPQEEDDPPDVLALEEHLLVVAAALFRVLVSDMRTHADIESSRGSLGHRTHELLLVLHQELQVEAVVPLLPESLLDFLRRHQLLKGFASARLAPLRGILLSATPRGEALVVVLAGRVILKFFICRNHSIKIIQIMQGRLQGSQDPMKFQGRQNLRGQQWPDGRWENW